MPSYHEFIENVFDYDGEILCKVLKLHSRIELVQIDLISLDTNDDDSKRTRVKTNYYTDNHRKLDNNKKVTERTQTRLSEETAKQLFSCGKGKEATEVLNKDDNRRKKM